MYVVIATESDQEKAGNRSGMRYWWVECESKRVSFSAVCLRLTSKRLSMGKRNKNKNKNKKQRERSSVEMKKD